ncbi:Uncharacterised protein [Candidatus Venteria ishoeyi]|uniref:Uncharacterized protein n=1 Tax=Candidatus Venteria ishoeyi TaxID=1899563 RepID=A0A1H6F740_9GAMM|nr:Uncharacterised protein [Candidatus Venteria ishoeyi]
MFYFLGFVFPLISRIPQTCIPRIPQATSGLLVEYLCSESYTEFPVFTNDSDNTFFDGNILYFNAMHLAGSVFNIKFCYIPLGSHDFYFKLIDLQTTQ